MASKDPLSPSYSPTPSARLAVMSLGVCLILGLGSLACGGAAEPDSDAEGDDYADRMAEEHAEDTAEASPAASQEPAVPVVGEEVTYGTLDGVELTGYLARPADAGDGPLPSLVVIQEWWGLNDNIRAVARRLAGEGYEALAVDLYDDRVATDRDQARELVMEARANPERLLANLRAGHAFLEQRGAPRIGSIGWCFGGGLSLQLALDVGDELDAAVMYYGSVVTEKEALEGLQTPLLGLFGADDGGIPVDQVEAMAEALHELDKEASVVIYPNADHAFANPTGNRYQEEAATAAWQETRTFFARHLQGAAPGEASR